MSEYFVTCVGLKNEQVEKVEEVCGGIFLKDKSFLWAINKSQFEKYDHLLRVRSETKEKAHKRGLLLVRNYLKDLNLIYWVKGGNRNED